METVSRGPQPMKDRLETKARSALQDPSVSPDNLNALADQLEQHANFKKAVANLEISAATGGIAGTAVAKTIGAKLSAMATAAVGEEAGLLGGFVAGAVGLVVDPASVLGAGSVEEALAAALRDEAVRRETIGIAANTIADGLANVPGYSSMDKKALVDQATRMLNGKVAQIEAAEKDIAKGKCAGNGVRVRFPTVLCAPFASNATLRQEHDPCRVLAATSCPTSRST